MQGHRHRRNRRRGWASRWIGAVAAVTVVATVAAACGSDDAGSASSSLPPGSTPAAGVADTTPATTTAQPAPPSDTTASAATRSVETELGVIEVPVDPQRVVALDEYAALNALAVGVTPVLVFASFQSEVGGQVLRSAGIEIQPGAAEAGPNLEAIAAARPDLILFTTEGALTSNVDQLQAIAPAVSLPYTTPWRDVIRATAEVFGASDAAERLVTVLDERIADLHARIAADPSSLSILADTLGMTFAVAMKAPLSQVVAEVGFTRPQAQLDGEADPTFDSAVMISLETLADHDADVVAVLSGAYYNANTLLDAPTFQALGGVVAGHSVVVDGDMWFGTYPFAIWWLLDDLAAIHAGEGQAGIGGADDVDARWAAFEAAL